MAAARSEPSARMRSICAGSAMYSDMRAVIGLRRCHRDLGQGGLEGAEALTLELRQHLVWRHVRKRRVDVHEVLRLGPILQPVHAARQRFGIGAGLPDLLRDGVGIIRQVDAAGVRRVGLGHLLRAVAQRHHTGRDALDQRLGDGEMGDAVVVVELGRDVARQLQVLLLILAHGHGRCLIGQDVGRHQRGIGQQAEAGVLAVLARLVLELRHPVHPADPRHRVEQPCHLRMGADLALVEQDRLRRIDAGRHERRRSLADAGAQDVRFLPDGDRVQVDDAVDRLGLAALQRREPLQRAQVVAKRQPARGLDAREDAGAELGIDRVGHERPALEFAGPWLSGWRDVEATGKEIAHAPPIRFWPDPIADQPAAAGHLASGPARHRDRGRSGAWPGRFHRRCAGGRPRLDAIRFAAFPPELAQRIWQLGVVDFGQVYRAFSFPFVHTSLTHALFVIVFTLALGNMVAQNFRPAGRCWRCSSARPSAGR